MKPTAAQKRAVREAILGMHKDADLTALVENVCAAFIEATQDRTEYVVITRAASTGALFAYGPYRGFKSAMKGVQSKEMLGEKGIVLPMRPVPRGAYA